MDDKRAILWLKAAFMAGAVTDALALIPMLFDGAARIFWGFDSFSGTYIFAMRLAAVFMLAWTILLLCAWRNPLEKAFIAPLTILIIAWFFALEIWAVINGVMALGKALPSIVLQVLLATLFSYGYLNALKIKRKSASSHDTEQHCV